jgi:hypothetical protein
MKDSDIHYDIHEINLCLVTCPTLSWVGGGKSCYKLNHPELDVLCNHQSFQYTDLILSPFVTTVPYNSVATISVFGVDNYCNQHVTLFSPFITITNIRHVVNWTVCQGIVTLSSRVLGSLAKYVHMIRICNGTESIKQILTEYLSVAQRRKQIRVPYKTPLITVLTPARHSSQS